MKPILKYTALAISSGLGVGYSPYAPGTCASVLGLFIFFFTTYFLNQPSLLFQISCAICLTIIGIIISDMTSRLLNVKDPSIVVIDEITGIVITLIGHEPDPLHLLTGLVLFRILDIFKPFPIRQMESLKGGIGIMADDIMAGLLANILLRIIPL